jgi:hypothetical protein
MRGFPHLLHAMVRTRFAPSPTGYLHVGGARTALYSWAYARKHGGTFILRIEDTDIERSTQASIDAILDGMAWLGLDWDEGPFYQMQRLERYAEVAQQLIKSGHAYWCYASKEELDAMREAQRARGEKPRYDGRWRPENAKGRRRRPTSSRSCASAIPTTASSPGTTWSRAASRSPTPSWTTSSCCAPTACRPTTSAWWWTTSTWASATASAATTTSTTRRGRSTSTARWARRCRPSPTCR